MNDIKNFLLEYGLIPIEITTECSLEQLFEREISFALKVKERNISQFIDLAVAGFMENAFYRDGVFRVKNPEKFTEKFNLTFKGYPYPDYFYDVLFFHLYLDEIYLLEPYLGKTKRIQNVLSEMPNRDDVFSNLIMEESRVRKIFESKEERKIIDGLLLERIHFFSGQLLCSKENAAFAEKLKAEITKEFKKRIYKRM